MRNMLILISRSSVLLETNISVIIIEQCVIEGKAIEIGLTYEGIKGSYLSQPWEGKSSQRNFLGKTTSRNAS